MEGFIKVIKKNNIQELRKYFFYLTYNDRANLHIVKDESKKAKYNRPINIKTYNPIKTYWDYRHALNKEWKKNRTKSIELIMSFSTQLNKIMLEVLGEEKWEIINRNIVKKVLLENPSKYKMLYFHKYDSTGYRYHVHALLYPYKLNKKNESVLYNHIEAKELKFLKENYTKYIKEITNKFKKEIRNYLLKEANVDKSQEEEFIKLFFEENVKLKEVLKI
jgi:hypothetical protein